ncbi:MAG: hypothetical protein KAI47_14875 [Deltaproteobacteria bacterium]|nr:hypothetical protein [Deltaproteobacteria bacterium]
MQIKPPRGTRAESPGAPRNTPDRPTAPKKHFSLHGPPPGPSARILTPKPAKQPTLPAAVEDIERQRHAIDRLLDQAARGRDFSPQQLLGLQATVYRYNENVEVLSRVVDKSVGALKTLLNTQV